MSPAGAVDTEVNGNCSLIEAISAAEGDVAVDNCPAGFGVHTVILPSPSIFTLTAVVDATGGSNGFPLVNSAITVEETGEEGVGVMIDIKPNEEPNALNLGSNGNIPIEILRSTSFDATTVVPISVTLAGSRVRIKGNGDAQASIKDVNGDGLDDLIVHADTEALELTEVVVSAALQAETVDGTTVRGSDSVMVVP